MVVVLRRGVLAARRSACYWSGLAHVLAGAHQASHQGTIAHQQRFLVRTRTRQHTEEWGNADTHSQQYVNTHYTHALLQ